MAKKEILSNEGLESDNAFSLRPHYLKNFVGQENIKVNLSVFIRAAKIQTKNIRSHVVFTASWP